MNRISAIKHYLYSVYNKLYNTLLWLITPKDKIIVLNAWVQHRGKKVFSYNLGDDINYDIVSFLSNKKVISYKCSYVSVFHPVNYTCIGSVVDYMMNERSIVWGSGAIGYNKTITPPAKVYAVRGPLTREYLIKQQIDCPQVYGDPALLLPMIYNPQQEKKYKLGVIPHIVDQNVDILSNLVKKFGEAIIIIDFRNYKRWQDVIDLMKQCEMIASSSLHGLIISDAYRIPNVWIKLSNNIIGEDFKYYDYFGGCGRECEPPLDFTEGNILIESIENRARSWNPISFNRASLLNSCPFIIDSLRVND